jgi:predicted ATPase/DNA-binding CsgD family transcriptional regulator
MPAGSARGSRCGGRTRGRRAGRATSLVPHDGHGGGPAPSGTLPAPISSFVGREREIAEVARLLGRARLLTLTGAGGVGKSRLALEVAGRQREQFPDGVRLAELAALADRRLLARIVATSLGVREQAGQELLATLIAFLRPRQLLLVLDNCEHLAETCAALVGTLLQACPRLRILATSRLPLGAPGEILWRVPSLALPDPERPSPMAIVESEAARLFVERAGAALRMFRLAEAQAPAVAEICRRLDGIPLAIELAAALVPALTVEQIARRLDDRFALLTGGSRAGLPRHRTLRALVDWSYDLASEPERTVLRRLAVFSGGWTLEAAERVASCEWRVASGEPDHSQLPTPNSLRSALARLVAASLVMTDGARGETRFHLLETIRAYALEQLRTSGEEPDIRRRHAEWVVALTEQAEPQLVTAEQKIWSERMERELPNLRAALAWSVESGATEVGLRILGSLWSFWERRGHLAEARYWLGALLAVPAAALTAARARAAVLAGYFAYLQGDRASAVPLTDEATALARTVDDPFAIVTALLVQGVLAAVVSDFDRSEAYLREAYDRSRAAGVAVGERIALMNLGELARMRGEDQKAAVLLEEASALSEAAGDSYPRGYTMMSLGHLRLHQGDLAAAGRCFGRALTGWNDLDDVHTVPHGFEGLAWTAAAAGRAERAACLLGAASALRERVGGALYPHWLADHQRATETARAALGERAFEAAWRQGRAMSREQAVAYALSPDSEPDVLTAREREIAVLVAEGRVNREIGEALGLSERTVEWHVSNLLGKIGVRSRAQIVGWTLARGLVGESRSRGTGAG